MCASTPTTSTVREKGHWGLGGGCKLTSVPNVPSTNSTKNDLLKLIPRSQRSLLGITMEWGRTTDSCVFLKSPNTPPNSHRYTLTHSHLTSSTWLNYGKFWYLLNRDQGIGQHKAQARLDSGKAMSVCSFFQWTLCLPITDPQGRKTCFGAAWHGDSWQDGFTDPKEASESCPILPCQPLPTALSLVAPP